MQALDLIWLLVGLFAGGIVSWVLSSARCGDALKAKAEALGREAEAKLRVAEIERKLEAKDAELRQALSENGNLKGESGRLTELRADIAQKAAQIEGLNANVTHLTSDKIKAETERDKATKGAETLVANERSANERIVAAKDAQIAALTEFIANARSALTTEFQVLSSEVLAKASKSLLEATDGLIKGHEERSVRDVALHKTEIENLLRPVSDTLGRLDEKVRQTDDERKKAETLLNEQITRLAGASESLTSALRKPVIRGSWGEMTLENALENAGLRVDIDYILQHTTSGEEGNQRTDAIIQLPKGGKLVIDSKNLMETYIPLAIATDEKQRALLADRHSKSLRAHMNDLKSKGYWKRYDGLDCVLLFIPDDGMYHAAIRDEGDLIRSCCESRVFITNPMSLMPLLKAVSYVLEQERSNKSAKEIRDVGMELYADIVRFSGHMAKIGEKIKSAATAYNDSLPSLDRYIVAKSRKLKEFGASKGDEAVLPEPIDLGPRLFASPELRAANRLLDGVGPSFALAASDASSEA